MNNCRLVAIVTLLMGAVASADAAPPAPPAKTSDAPKTQPASQPRGQKVTVVSVTGRAQRMMPDGKKKWVPLKAGDVLDELTIIRTGFRTTVVLRFADRGTMTIDGVTKIGLGEFRKSGRTATTRLGLKYGTFRAKVDSRVGPSDWQVKTPTATLSVRGSEPVVGFTVDGGPRGQSLGGRLTLATRQTSQTVVPGESVSSTPVVPVQQVLQQIVPFLGDSAGGSTVVERHGYQNNAGGRAAIGGFTPSQNNTGPGAGPGTGLPHLPRNIPTSPEGPPTNPVPLPGSVTVLGTTSAD